MKSQDHDSPNSALAKAGRDAETIELFGDFVAESEDGLCRVDEILLGAQRSAISDEQVNELFRVFHTIKGVSGFLEALDVTRLAHVTETLLDGARSHAYALNGKVLDAVFEASTAMRKLLLEVRQAVESDRVIAQDHELGVVVEKVENAVAGPEQTSRASAKPSAQKKSSAQGSVAPRAAQPSARPTRNASDAPKPAVPRPGASQFPEFSQRPTALPRPTLSQNPTADSALDPCEVSPPSQRPNVPSQRAAVSKAPSASRVPGQSQRPSANQEATAEPVERGGSVRLRETVKVDLERIDSVVEMIGELLIVQSIVVSAPEIAALPSLRLRNSLGQLTKISRDLQSVAMRMRMIPVRGVFHKMARLTRDLSRKTGKTVELVQLGEATEMDRSMVERIEEPLVHMIRNAMDHAIEPAEDRAAAGKPEVGTIKLSAQHEAGCIAIEITDDGKGLRREAIIAKAKDRGLLSENAESLTDEQVFALIFLPGFSTAAKLSELSGRGVGMDVVKRSIEGMRGRVVVRSTPGVGTTFKLILPLTLAIIDGMIVSCSGETYIIPSLAIVESLQVSNGMIGTLGAKGELLNVRGEILPLVRLGRVAGLQSQNPAGDQAHIVVVESLGKKLGLAVDEVVTQQQIVIKPLSSGLGDTDLFAGAAILANGRVGLILNVDRLSTLAPPRVKSLDRSEAA